MSGRFKENPSAQIDQKPLGLSAPLVIHQGRHPPSTPAASSNEIGGDGIPIIAGKADDAPKRTKFIS